MRRDWKGNADVPYLSDEDTQRGELEGVLQRIVGFTVDTLIRTNLGPEWNLERGRPVFERTLALFGRLHLTDLELVPSEQLTKLKPVSDRALQRLEEIDKFTPSHHENPPREASMAIDRLYEVLQDAYQLVVPILSYGLICSSDTEPMVRQAERDSASISDLRKRSGDTCTEIDELLKKAQQSVELLGVTKYVEQFHDEAERHNVQSKWWAAGVVIAGGLTAWLSWMLLQPGEVQGSSIEQTIPLVFSRFAILTMPYAGVLWAGRCFFASRHNHIVNRHRRNALATFQLFRDTSDDPETRRAVLLHAMQAIFQPQATGLSKHGSASEPGASIIGLVAGSSKFPDGSD